MLAWATSGARGMAPLLTSAVGIGHGEGVLLLAVQEGELSLAVQKRRQ